MQRVTSKDLAEDVIIRRVANRDTTIRGLWFIGMLAFTGGILLKLLATGTTASHVMAQVILPIQLAGIGLVLASSLLVLTVNRCPACKQRLNWQLKELRCPACDAQIRIEE
jgi:hypothetical protein